MDDSAREEQPGAAVVPFPGARAVRYPAARLPSGRAVLAAFAALATALALYAAARETSMFALRSVEVTGASASVGARVRGALAPLSGRSLVTLDGHDVERRLRAIPQVASATFDRHFPHTLRVTVDAEDAVAVVRLGADAWLASGRGRVLRAVPRHARPRLARVWLTAGEEAVVGAPVSERRARVALRALAFARAANVGWSVRVARLDERGVVLLLRSGLELRLGSARALRVKIAVARRLVPTIIAGAGPGTYLDVGEPERPVAFLNPQFEG